MAVPKEFIQTLLDRIDIVDLIGQRIRLKRRGQRYLALCPFHNEKTPSFNVDSQKQFFYCFGCRASGTALNFIMRLDGLDFIDAVKYLAEQQGLQVPQTDSRTSNQDGRYTYLADILDEATHRYRQYLEENPTASTYVKKRNISTEVVDEMRLGYAPAAWNTIENILKDKYSKQDLISVGLIKKSERDPTRSYDVFRNRILFPIRNMRGHTIGFGGRTLDSQEPAKYINTSATSLFHKKTEIYGLFEIVNDRQDKSFEQEIYLVEGYMDVVAMKSFGIKNAVACMGTAVSRQQLQMLMRKTKKLILCFDGDQAGRQAAWAAIEQALPILSEKAPLQVVFLPEGEDPSSILSQQGREALADHLSREKLEIDEFIYRKLTTDLDLRQISAKASFAKRLLDICEKISSDLYQTLIFDSLSERAGIGKTMERIKRERGQKSRPNQPDRFAVQIESSAYNHLVLLLLSYPELITRIESGSDLFLVDAQGWLKSILECQQENSAIASEELRVALADKLSPQKYDDLIAMVIEVGPKINSERWPSQPSEAEQKNFENLTKQLLRQVQYWQKKNQLKRLQYATSLNELPEQDIDFLKNISQATRQTVGQDGDAEQSTERATPREELD